MVALILSILAIVLTVAIAIYNLRWERRVLDEHHDRLHAKLDEHHEHVTHHLRRDHHEN